MKLMNLAEDSEGRMDLVNLASLLNLRVKTTRYVAGLRIHKAKWI